MLGGRGPPESRSGVNPLVTRPSPERADSAWSGDTASLGPGPWSPVRTTHCLLRDWRHFYNLGWIMNGEQLKIIYRNIRRWNNETDLWTIHAVRVVHRWMIRLIMMFNLKDFTLIILNLFMVNNGGRVKCSAFNKSPRRRDLRAVRAQETFWFYLKHEMFGLQ